MKFKKKLHLICEQERIKLKEFSNLTEIPYGTIKNYSSGQREPTLDQIQKILAVPRFIQYKDLLLALDLNVAEDTAPYNVPEEAARKAAELFRRLEALGRGDEALAILEAIETSAKKK